MRSRRFSREVRTSWNSLAPEYVRYHDSIETVLPDEQEVINQIIQSMTRETDTVAKREQRAVRASHAKSTGALKGKLRVLDGLPPHLAQGLFAQARTFPAAARFAQGPGEHLSDSVSTHRGMAVKLFGADGPALPGHAGDTQDFVFATGSAFPQGNAASFLTAIKGLEKATPAPEALKQAVSSTARAAVAAVRAVGGNSPTLGFFGHTKRNPLADAYYSQAALRYGDYVAKMGFFPASPELLAIADEALDTGADPDAFRTAAVGFMRARGAEFEPRALHGPGRDAGRGCLGRLARGRQPVCSGGAPDAAGAGCLQPGARGLLRRRARVPPGAQPGGAPAARLAHARATDHLPGAVSPPARAQRPAGAGAGIHRRRAGLATARPSPRGASGEAAGPGEPGRRRLTNLAARSEPASQVPLRPDFVTEGPG